MIDIYKVLPDSFFEQIGDFSDDEEKYAPINYDYEPVCTELYTANSFYGPEFVDLFVDHEEKTYYVRSAIRQPIGDYAWSTVWSWYKSLPDKYEEIKSIIDQQMTEAALVGAEGSQ